MKAFVIAAVAGAALLTTACANDYYGPRHFHDGRGGYAVYYDDHYGPVRDGRWGEDGYYYYRTGDRDAYVRDDERHFRRDAYEGYHGMNYGGDGAVGVQAGASVGIGVRP